MKTDTARTIENAKRLLADAEGLATNGAHRTATALCVLAIEEAGKSCVLQWREAGHMPPDEAKGILREHLPKQSIFAAYTVTRIVMSMSRIVKVEDAPYVPPADMAAFRERLASALEAEQVSILPFEVGILDGLKQAALYHDPDVASEAEWSEVWYVALQDFAKQSIGMAQSDAFTHEIASILFRSRGKRKRVSRDALVRMLAAVNNSKLS